MVVVVVVVCWMRWPWIDDVVRATRPTLVRVMMMVVACRYVVLLFAGGIGSCSWSWSWSCGGRATAMRPSKVKALTGLRSDQAC